MKKRAFAALAALIIIVSVTVPAMAAVNGGVINQYQSAYLTGENGADLMLDAVTLNIDSGTVAYMLEPSKISARADATYDEYAESNEQFLRGARIIMQMLFFALMISTLR